ncbi:hypothetical protein CRE_29184 [Caenorhabditis remanei]|uniref:Uncharacterized protein n=1 Tax=Caenorhabditis remanei TaxID=31234 RepID=E3ND46_CAERE|nr:hypothetical protein CRE_29184 [Caenorhabditis remanei]
MVIDFFGIIIGFGEGFWILKDKQMSETEEKLSFPGANSRKTGLDRHNRSVPAIAWKKLVRAPGHYVINILPALPNSEKFGSLMTQFYRRQRAFFMTCKKFLIILNIWKE